MYKINKVIAASYQDAFRSVAAN